MKDPTAFMHRPPRANERIHLVFEDGAEICVLEEDALFYIQKYEADGYPLTGACQCFDGCPLRPPTSLFDELLEAWVDPLPPIVLDALDGSGWQVVLPTTVFS
jgi:hypothetical protein